MSLGKHSGPDPASRNASRNEVPVTNKAMMAAAGVLLALPVIALMWVPSYTKTKPELWGFPFFFWYQFLWVFLCSAATWSAFKLTLAARRGSGSRTGRDR